MHSRQITDEPRLKKHITQSPGAESQCTTNELTPFEFFYTTCIQRESLKKLIIKSEQHQTTKDKQANCHLCSPYLTQLYIPFHPPHISLSLSLSFSLFFSPWFSCIYNWNLKPKSKIIAHYWLFTHWLISDKVKIWVVDAKTTCAYIIVPSCIGLS